MPSTVVKRRFEFVEGTSSKFWEICLSDHEVRVKYGRIGADGQALTKSFDSADAAAQHADRLIRQKTAKGYVGVGA